jgi:hypothetical protein
VCRPARRARRSAPGVACGHGVSSLRLALLGARVLVNDFRPWFPELAAGQGRGGLTQALEVTGERIARELHAPVLVRAGLA